MPASVDFAGADEEWDADVVELAVAERRADVALVAVALADEDPQSALRSGRIRSGLRGIAPGKRIAKIIERRAAADQSLLERGERLAHVDQQFFIIRRRIGAEPTLIAARILSVPADEFRRVRCVA